MTDNPQPITMAAALAQLQGCGDALRVVIAEIEERDARIAELEAAITEALRLHRAGCGDAYQALTTALGQSSESRSNA